MIFTKTLFELQRPVCTSYRALNGNPILMDKTPALRFFFRRLCSSASVARHSFGPAPSHRFPVLGGSGVWVLRFLAVWVQGVGSGSRGWALQGFGLRPGVYSFFCAQLFGGQVPQAFHELFRKSFLSFKQFDGDFRLSSINNPPRVPTKSQDPNPLSPEILRTPYKPKT